MTWQLEPQQAVPWQLQLPVPQLTTPGLQPGVVQELLWQIWPPVHGLLQAPQWLLLLVRLISQPSVRAFRLQLP
jgi:hypothetical protein